MSVGADLVFPTGKFRLVQERIFPGCGILERVPPE